MLCFFFLGSLQLEIWLSVAATVLVSFLTLATLILAASPTRGRASLSSPGHQLEVISEAAQVYPHPTNIARVNLVVGCSKVFFFSLF